MRIFCTICGDLFHLNAIISTTACGHAFHNHCLLQWLENSKTCPQCRHKTTEKNIHRLFLDISPNEVEVDPDTLQHTIDSLRFQVVEKDQLLSRFKEENIEFKDQTKGLREECLKLEKKCKEKDTTLSALKEQSKYLNELVKKVSKAEDEAINAKAQLKLFSHIDDILQENNQNIDETISANYNTSNPQESIKSLATVNSFLKSHVTKLKEEKRRHLEDIQSLHSKIKEFKKNIFYLESRQKEDENKIILLTEDNKSLENEIASLNKKVSSLQNAINSPSADVKNSVIQRLLSESPAPSILKNYVNLSDEINLTPEIIKTVSRLPMGTHDANKLSSNLRKENSSPYLQLKEASINPMNYMKPQAQTNNVALNKNAAKGSIFKNGRNTANMKSGPSKVPQECSFPGDDVGYDGLGGHHKVDYFPKPNANKLYPSKKRLKEVHVVSNKGTKFGVSNPVIKDYFKNTFSD